MTLMTTLFVVCGKVNYTNLSRYSDRSERTYRRHFEAGLGLESLNQVLIEQVIADTRPQIAVVDCTFTEKSGRHTYGLDWFYNGKTQRAERGLEWSVVAVVDVAQKTGYALSAQQTEAGLGAQEPPASDETVPPKSRVDFYLGHLAYLHGLLSRRDSLHCGRWLLQQVQMGDRSGAVGPPLHWTAPQ